MIMGSSLRDLASTILGMSSVIVWMVAEIPQIMTNYREKSVEGLSIAFLMTWMTGDIFNALGCMLEPATLPTQLYIAVLYSIISTSLCFQAIYYGHIYPHLKYNRQPKHGQIDTSTNAAQIKSGTENANDADQSYRFDGFKTGTGLSSPIHLSAHAQKSYAEARLYYQSARYLSKSHTSTSSILGRRLAPTSHNVSSMEEPLLGSSIITQSAPDLKIKTTLCLASTLTFLGAFSLLHSQDTRVHSMASKPRQEFVIYVGRKLFQVSGKQLTEHGVAGSPSIGTLLGWAMAIIYISGRIPQICLNIRKGNFEGVNPLMFLFALTGNVTYVSSILVKSMDWSRIGPVLPWLIEPGGCALLDFFILLQYIYFQYRTSRGQESKGMHHYVA